MGELRGAGSKWNKIWFFLGLAAVTAMGIPCLMLGEDAIFNYHDQLDGELIAYILQARHLFRGDILPEFLGGVSKTALTPPAPGFVLLFLGGDYAAALLIMQMAGSLTGYVGMYLLARECRVQEGIAMTAAVLFAYIPFLPVYGLSQYGIPLLFWCALQLRKGRHIPAAYLYTACYALTSSLVLVGFGLLGMGLVWLLWLLWRQRERALPFLGAWLLLLGIYVAENWRLLGELLGKGGGEISHKSEYVLKASPFLPTLWQNLTRGGQHSEDHHFLLLVMTLAALALGALFREERVRRLQRRVGVCLLWNLALSLAAAFWDSGAGVFLRNRMSAFRAFQVNRLLWIAPTFWYLAFACGGMICLELLLCRRREEAAGTSRSAAEARQPAGTSRGAAEARQPAGMSRGIAAAGQPAGMSRGIAAAGLSACAFCGIAAAVTGVQLLMAGDVKSNIQKLRNPDYGLLSFRDYFAVGVMEQVESCLRETAGLDPSEYRVVSLGIDPAAALYHGFYCLDGYSNHYPVSYKHDFRRILAPELERSDYLREYFDDWGNRCYLFSSECPGYYTIEKGGFFFQDYRLDTGALKELGGDYVLSAAYIANAEEQGLALVNETPLETEDSYYRIYIYEVALPAGNMEKEG